MLHATTVETVHCTRDVQKEIGVHGHDLLKLMLASYSCMWLYSTPHLSLKH